MWHDETDTTEEALAGRVTVSVTRIGNTVRRPVGPWTDSVDALLAHLDAVGFEGAPKPLGRDEQGRQVLEFIPGTVGTPLPTYSPAELSRIGRLLGDLHTATSSFEPPAGAIWNRVIEPDREELICHNDPAPWNLVMAPDRWAFVDWDFAGPGSRLWDLAYCAQTSVPLDADHRDTAGLRALVDGYDLDEAGRRELALMLGRRPRAMYDMLQARGAKGEEPWATIWTEDGPYWDATADHLTQHATTFLDALL